LALTVGVWIGFGHASAASSGSITRSPWCTRHTASANTSVRVSLSKYPEALHQAPVANSRAGKYSKNIIRVAECWRLSSAAASSPVICGISISVIKKSGFFLKYSLYSFFVAGPSNHENITFNFKQRRKRA
jgi:hypothetical protein